MATIQEIRQQFPQYNDMSDEDLAKALHQKFYSDMPYDQFATKIGVQRSNASGKRDQSVNVWSDMGRSAAAGAGRGIVGIPGIPGDLASMQPAFNRALGLPDSISPEQRAQMEQLGLIPKQGSGLTVNLPTSEDVIGAANNAIRPAPSVSQLATGEQPKTFMEYQPKTIPGEYAKTTGEFAAGAIGPGGVVRKAAQVVLPAVASETAGQLTKGTPSEPYARFAGALLGGGVAAKGSAAKEIAKAAPEQGAVKAAADTAYSQLRAAGVTYDANAYGQMLQDLETTLKQQGFHTIDAPQSTARLNQLAQYAGGSPDFSDLDSIRKATGRIIGDNSPSMLASDRAVASIIQDKIDEFMTNSPFSTNGSVPANQIQPLMAHARDMARRNIIARDIDEMQRKAENYVSGYESGMRNQVSSYLKKKGKSLTNEERAALQDIQWNSGANATEALGKLGFNVGKWASKANAFPAALMYLGGGFNPATLGIAGLGTAARYASPYVRGAVVNRAKDVVLAGKKAQRRGLLQSQEDTFKRGLLNVGSSLMQLPRPPGL